MPSARNKSGKKNKSGAMPASPAKAGGRVCCPRDSAMDAETSARTTPGDRPRSAKLALQGTVFPRWASPSMSIVPDTFTTDLSYSDLITVGPNTSQLLGVHVFSCGGLYDPDITGTGHQPLGFDQMMAFYNHYVVTHARIEVQGFITGVANVAYVAGTGRIAVCPTASSTPLTSAAQFWEHPYSEAGVAGRASGVKGDLVKCSIDIPKWFGVSTSQFIADDTHRGTASANPSEDSFFQIGGVRDAYSDSSSVPITCRVRIVYRCVFLERKELALS